MVATTHKELAGRGDTYTAAADSASNKKRAEIVPHFVFMVPMLAVRSLDGTHTHAHTHAQAEAPFIAVTQGKT